MQIRRFRGSRTVMSFRLCSRAPWTTSSSAAMRGPFYRANGCSDRAISRPAVLVRVDAEAGFDRVLADVLAGVLEVPLRGDHPGGEAGAEEVAAASVAQVEPLRVA